MCTLLSIYGKYINNNAITAAAITLSILILIIKYLRNTINNHSKIFITILLLLFCDLMTAIIDTNTSVRLSMIGTIAWSLLLFIENKQKIRAELNTISNKLTLTILVLSCGMIYFVMSREIREHHLLMCIVTIITISNMFFSFVTFKRKKIARNLLYVISLMLFIL